MEIPREAPWKLAEKNVGPFLHEPLGYSQADPAIASSNNRDFIC